MRVRFAQEMKAYRRYTSLAYDRTKRAEMAKGKSPESAKKIARIAYKEAAAAWGQDVD